MAGWNLWHGCKKISEGCLNCYVYRADKKFDRASDIVKKTGSFYAPVKKTRNGEYKIKSGETVYTCFTSDFLIEDADEWRKEAFEIMKQRSDLNFLFITKRIDRLEKHLPPDWNDGYDNVCIGCTCENQRRADERLPIFLSFPIKHRFIACEPLLEKIDVSKYLFPDKINRVTVGGESGPDSRLCNYDWVLYLRKQCIERNIPFSFHQTGANFLMNGKTYHIERKYQHSQAQKANIDTDC